MKLYGLTGGIACGKSTVATLLENEHGCYVVDCDRIVRELQRPGARCTRRIAEAFAGDAVVDPSTGELDRAKLGDVVFNDAAKRRKLAAIMSGPVLRAVIFALVKAGLTLPWNAVVLLDAPLLYETGFFLPLCSAVVAVGCSEELQMRRLQSRNGLGREGALSRIRAQMPVAEKLRRSELPIVNEFASVDELRPVVAACARVLRAKNTWVSGWTRAVAAAVAAAGFVVWCLLRGRRREE